MVRIEEFLKTWCGFSDEKLVRKLQEDARVAEVKKGALLFEAGEVQTHLPILIRGVFRGFLLDMDGKEITDCFAHKIGDIVMSCAALGDPAKVSMEAITDCEVLTIPLDEVLAAMKQYPELLRVHNRYLSEALTRHWEEKILMHRCSAMQRYHWFLKEYPDLVDTVSNKHIASFLGITPVSLSRLRRQIREQAEEKRLSAAE